jgi:hypothetical protein
MIHEPIILQQAIAPIYVPGMRNARVAVQSGHICMQVSLASKLCQGTLIVRKTQRASITRSGVYLPAYCTRGIARATGHLLSHRITIGFYFQHDYG